MRTDPIIQPVSGGENRGAMAWKKLCDRAVRIALGLVCVPYLLLVLLVTHEWLSGASDGDPLGILVVDVTVCWIFVGGGIALLIVAGDAVCACLIGSRVVLRRVILRDSMVVALAVGALPVGYMLTALYAVHLAPSRNIWDAVRRGRISEVEDYLDANPLLVQSQDRLNGGTPLHACDSVVIAELLVSRGADVNAKPFGGDTPLHVVAGISGSQPMIVYLISKGADVNAVDDDGNTPLHVAAKWYPRNVAVLLDHGANPDIRNRAGLTPLDMAELGVQNTQGAYRQEFADAVKSLGDLPRRGPTEPP